MDESLVKYLKKNHLLIQKIAKVKGLSKDDLTITLHRYRKIISYLKENRNTQKMKTHDIISSISVCYNLIEDMIEGVEINTSDIQDAVSASKRSLDLARVAQDATFS